MRPVNNDQYNRKFEYETAPSSGLGKIMGWDPVFRGSRVPAHTIADLAVPSTTLPVNRILRLVAAGSASSKKSLKAGENRQRAKASQISAVGWSLGGGAVLAALGQLTAADNSPLRAVVAYYPYCRDLQPWRAKVPALSLMGAQDEVAPPEVCQRVFAQLPPGTALQARVYPEARHGFDVSDLPPYAKFGSEIVGYNAGADAAAAREVEQFMSRKTD
jgi:pimeloyl-ACP methyl ester carboxylesterase